VDHRGASNAEAAFWREAREISKGCPGSSGQAAAPTEGAQACQA